MWHMPYEGMQVGDEGEDAPGTPGERHAASEPEEGPGRTPHTAEGADTSERKMPLEEPGHTPGTAEGD